MRRLLLVLVLLILSSPAAAVWWDRVGDLHTGGGNCMLPDPAHERLFIGGGSGYRIYYPLTNEWLVREDTYSSSIYSLLAHPTDPLFLLSGWYGAFFNGWVEDHYGLVTEGPVVLGGAIGAVMGLARLPGQDDLLYACAMDGEGDPGGVFSSIDGGQSWTFMHDLSPSDPTALAITPDGDLLVGLTYPIGIARGVDAGESWVDATGDMPCAAEGYIKVVAVDPADPQHLYALQSRYFYQETDPAHGVYASTDGGSHWEQIFAAAVHDLCMDPTDGDVLVALFDGGVALTRNGGGTWVDIQGNLPDFRACAIMPTDDRIYVSTHSDGLWATDASPTAAGEAPAAAPALGAYPNPFNPQTTLVISLSEPGAVSLCVLDAQGRLVRSLLAGEPRPAGLQCIAWDGRDDAGRALPSGLYFAQLAAGGERVGRKLMMVR